MNNETVTMEICGDSLLIDHFENSELKINDGGQLAKHEKTWHTWIKNGDELLYKSGTFERVVSIKLETKHSQSFGMEKYSDYDDFLKQVKSAKTVTMQEVVEAIL